MTSKKRTTAKKAAGAEAHTQEYVDALRRELRRHLAASGHLFTKLSKELGHSPTYLSSMLADDPRTEIRLSTVLRVLAALDLDPARFFFRILEQVNRRLGVTDASSAERSRAQILKWIQSAPSSRPSPWGKPPEPAALLRMLADMVEDLGDSGNRTEPDDDPRPAARSLKVGQER